MNSSGPCANACDSAPGKKEEGGEIGIADSCHTHSRSTALTFRDEDTSTCQLNGDGSGAVWSVARHPGCEKCSNDCVECSGASQCNQCALGWLDEGVCKRGSGLQQKDAAKSCLDILKMNPKAESRNRGYWIRVPGMCPDLCIESADSPANALHSSPLAVPDDAWADACVNLDFHPSCLLLVR